MPLYIVNYFESICLKDVSRRTKIVLNADSYMTREQHRWDQLSCVYCIIKYNFGMFIP